MATLRTILRFEKSFVSYRPKGALNGLWAIMVLFPLLCGCQDHQRLSNESWAASDQKLDARIIQVLETTLADEDPVLRCHGLESLASWGAPNALPMIRKSLHDPVPAVRYIAAIAAGDIKDYNARPVLGHLLKDENISVKLGAGYALEKMGDKRFGQWFDNVLLSGDENLAGQGCMLIGKLGNTPIRLESKKKLWHVMRKADQHPSVRLQAAEALARLGDKEVLSKLLVFSGSGYADDRVIAISGLELLGGPEANGMLSVLLDDEQLEVKLAALRALGKTADPSYYSIARDNLNYVDGQGDPQATLRVRQLAILALGKIGDERDAGSLLAGMHAKSKYLQIAAARAGIDYLKVSKTRNLLR
ncbi:MAG: HEAT repeat domain-containing protein [Phycisphaerae bacterium]|nr:HEAT repeat domain-containing protein [Phycisphaerae bacterium]